MKRAAWCLLAVLAVAGCSPGPNAEPRECTEITVRRFAVVRVIDGDTFTVMYDGEQTSVRIAGIDSPEPRDPGGVASRAALEAMIAGHEVVLSFPGPRKRDGFGRLLCDVRVGETDVGAAMVASGHAVWSK